MNKYPKYLLMILAALCIGCFVFGVFGLHTTYGDITTTIANDALSPNAGLGLEDAVELIYEYTGDEELTDELCAEVCSVLRARLFAGGVSDCAVSYDLAMKSFAVELVWGAHTTYNLSAIYSNLGAVGKLELRAGKETAEDGSPAGETAETVIADNSGLVSAKASQTIAYTSLYQNLLTLQFGGAAKSAIKAYTEQALAAQQADKDAAGADSTETFARSYSVWLDGTLLNSHTVDAVISNGAVAAGDSTYSYSSSGDYSGTALILSAGPLPVALTAKTIYNLSDPSPAQNYAAAAYGIGIAAALLAVWMLLRYRLLGLTETLALAGFLGALGIAVSGSMFAATGLFISRGVLGALLAGFAVSALFALSALEDARVALSALTPYKAIREAFARAERSGILALIAAGIVAAALRLALGANAAFYGVCEAAVAFVAALGCGYLTLVLAGAGMAKSAASWKALRNEKLYGGKR